MQIKFIIVAKENGAETFIDSFAKKGNFLFYSCSNDVRDAIQFDTADDAQDRIDTIKKNDIGACNLFIATVAKSPLPEKAITKVADLKYFEFYVE